jgi:cephalosporin-C deacetylase-like acetyl esterase
VRIAGLVAYFIARLSLAQELSVEPFEANGIYGLGEPAGWTITAPEDAGRVAEVDYVVRQNDFSVIATGRLDLSAPAEIRVVLDEPAMIRAELQDTEGDKPPVVVAAAIAPNQIEPSIAEPDDFDEFWADKIAQLHAVPSNPVLRPEPSGMAGVDYAILTMDHIGGAQVHGQVAKPAGEGPFPGLVIFQWASPPYPLEPEWVTDRAREGWLVVNIEPHDVLPDQPQAYYDALPNELKQYHTIGRTDRDRNYFLRMYLADYRAIDYLTSRADWNGETLVVTGTSMGGQQSLCSAGLHREVDALIVHVPSGADTSGPLHGRASGYPGWPTDDLSIVETARYFDTVNCASRITAASLVSMGFLDTISPPVGIWAVFNAIRGPKEIVPLVDAAHNHQATAEQQAPYTERAAEWLSVLARDALPTCRPKVDPAWLCQL